MGILPMGLPAGHTLLGTTCYGAVLSQSTQLIDIMALEASPVIRAGETSKGFLRTWVNALLGYGLSEWTITAITQKLIANGLQQSNKATIGAPLVILRTMAKP